MTEADVEITLQRAKEAFPGETPRVITDNVPQFIKEFIRQSGMTHVPLSIDEPYQVIERLMDDYNHLRLHSAIG